MVSVLKEPFDPITTRSCHRITSIFATNIESDNILGATGSAPSTLLRLGRMARFYDGCSQQLPRVAVRERLATDALTLERGDLRSYTVKGAWAWLFDVPAGPIVLAVSLDVECGVLDLIPLLEDLYYCDVSFDGQKPSDLARRLLEGDAELATVLARAEGVQLAPEAHQIVHLGAVPHAALPDHDVLQRLIYRADLDCIEQYSEIKYPTELNRRPTSLAALGPFVSVLLAQQDYIENGCFISAVQLVAAAAKVRDIREATRRSLEELTELGSNPGGAQRRGNEVRARLARSAERLAQQELQLTFGVESSCALNMLIPSLRLDSYHQTLATALGLDASAGVVSNMLQRLRAVIEAETNSLQSYLSRREELRRLRWGSLIGLLSAIAVPVGIVLSFFGGQAKQVHPHTSLFDLRLYLGLYVFLLVIAAVGIVTFGGLWFRERSELKRLRSR